VAIPDAPSAGADIVTGGSWGTRVLDVLLMVVAAVMFVDMRVNVYLDDPIYQTTAAVWIVLACVFIGVRLRRMRRGRLGDPQWTRRLQDVRLGRLVVATTVLTVVNAVTLLLAFSGDSGRHVVDALVAQGDDRVRTEELVSTYAASGLLLIVLSWAVLHLSYAERYARLWAIGRPRGVAHVDFPGGAEPTLTDFVYLAVTVGCTYATSDARVLTTEMRSRMIFHGMLSFLYTTVIVAATVSVLTG
jgi:uncharacterized membrane protein